MHITHGLQSLIACIPPTIHCRSTNCWELLHLFAHHCDYRPNNCQHCWPTNVGSYFVCLHVALESVIYLLGVPKLT